MQPSSPPLLRNAPLLHAHNAYPEGGRWRDRIDRALATGLPLVIEQDIAYDTLVKVMDTVRVFPVPGSKWDVAELFPDVSVGDAPT